MRKYINYLVVISLISFCASNNEPEVKDTTVLESSSPSTSSTQTTSSTSSTTTLQTVFATDEFGIEMLEPTEEMKKQLDDLITFIEKRTGLKFTQYPKFQLYTLEGYRDYSEASYLDDFEKDYEEGEWERAVLSENMWGLTTSSPDQMKKLIVTFQRCASAGSYNLLDETLRVPIKRNQKKFNFWEQSVIVHELVHSLQGQVVNLSNWYQDMKDSDDFMDYPGRRSIMEGQADLVQAYWESTLDSYDRQQMNSERPNFNCSVSLPSYFYIPFELYYGYGGSLIKQVHTAGKMEAINESLFQLPTAEQIYSPDKYFSEEPYINVEIETLELEDYSFIDKGQIDSLDIVYLLQSKIGQVDAVNAAIGLGGGSWVDYINNENDLFMTVKIQGDNDEELNEIAEAFMNWANFQSRFTKITTDGNNWNGNLYEGETNLWINNDGSYLRLALSNNLEFLINFLSKCTSDQCNTSF
tara:strand:+ start:649 stop:2055 length:1407 start_codon:yes stop_codon:yes gene_type:complete